MMQAPLELVGLGSSSSMDSFASWKMNDNGMEKEKREEMSLQGEDESRRSSHIQSLHGWTYGDLGVLCSRKSYLKKRSLRINFLLHFLNGTRKTFIRRRTSLVTPSTLIYIFIQ